MNMFEQNEAPMELPRKSKGIRKTIRQRLEVSLADYRSIVGEKKFDARIKKAARMLGNDISKALPKKKKSVSDASKGA